MPSHIPIFIAVDCGPLAKPLNGTKHGNETLFTKKIRFACHEGFDLKGSGIRECQANRQWSGQAAICKGAIS